MSKQAKRRTYDTAQHIASALQHLNSQAAERFLMFHVQKTQQSDGQSERQFRIK
jgi:hypothetical protein